MDGVLCVEVKTQPPSECIRLKLLAAFSFFMFRTDEMEDGVVADVSVGGRVRLVCIIRTLVWMGRIEESDPLAAYVHENS